jgi:two-component system CheB/CheR fusion protein
MAERVLNLIPGDLDRPIGHIKPNIDCPDLEKLITESIDTVAPVERDLQDSQGRWYSLRIRPYKSLDNRIEGAVLALFDVDVLKRSQARIRLAYEYADTILHSTEQAIAILERDLRIRMANAAFCRMFEVAPNQVEGKTLQDVGGLDLGALQSIIGVSAIGQGRVLEHIQMEQDRSDGGRRKLTITGRLLVSPEIQEDQFILLAISDDAKSNGTKTANEA